MSRTYLNTLAEHSDWVEQQLTGLSQKAQVAFAASCAEQLFPLYERFVQEERWGDAAAMRRGLDTAWEWCPGDPGAGLQRLRDECDALTPHTDDFSSLLGSAASSAGLAVVAALDCCASNDAAAAAAAAEYVLEVPGRALMPEDDAPDIPEAVAAELARQRAVLDALAADGQAAVEHARTSGDPQALARLV